MELLERYPPAELVRWQDFQSPIGSGPWQGLDLLIERADLACGAPVLRVRAGARRMRLECAGEPVLWAHVHFGHYGLWLLLAQRSASWSVVPPITSRVIASIRAAPHGEAWWRAWSRWFARALCASPRTPLFPGRWALTAGRAAGGRSPPVPAPPTTSWSRVGFVDDVRTCLDVPALRWESWFINGSGALVRARLAALPGAARARAYRKRVRDATLPPVLVQYVSGLDMFILLDGHDRLRAALLEGSTPPLLVLWRVRAQRISLYREHQDAVLREIERKRLLRGERERPLDVDAENRLLLAAFDDSDELSATTPAWPLEGGVARWEQQILAEGVLPGHPMFSGEPPPRG